MCGARLVSPHTNFSYQYVYSYYNIYILVGKGEIMKLKLMIIVLVLILSSTFAPLAAVWFTGTAEELNEFHKILIERDR